MPLFKRLQFLLPWRRRAAEREIQDELRSIAGMAEPRELGNLTLGAGRWRLVRQVLMEGLVLAGIAGACGIALAYWATHVLLVYVSAGRNPIALDLAPDVRVLGFTVGISALAGVLFATAPAIRASRLDMTSFGRQDLSTSRGSASGLQPGRLLVVAQVALSLLLLIGAGLFVRSLQQLNRQQLDVDRGQVLIVRVEPRGSDQRGHLRAALLVLVALCAAWLPARRASRIDPVVALRND